MSGYRPEFEEALRLFAQVSTDITRLGFAAPVLVGGAAVELYTASDISTGDFDVVTARQDVFERVLKSHGFSKPIGRHLIHPELLLGFEIVGSTLMDGLAERDRVRIVDAGSGNRLAVIAIEDLIADRAGQYHSGTAPAMLEQAVALFSLYQDADLSYLERRIRDETAGEYGLDLLHPPR